MMTPKVAANIAFFLGLVSCCTPRINEPQNDIEGVGLKEHLALKRYHGWTTAKAFAQAMPVLSPHKNLEPWYTTDKQGVWLYFDGSNNHRVFVRWGQPTQQKSKRRDLKGIRIAIDPGHFGGSYSSIEKRHLVINHGPILREGNITYATALFLQNMLQAQGAHVILTRGPPPDKPFPDVRNPKAIFANHQSVLRWLGYKGHTGVFAKWLRLRPKQMDLFIEAGRSTDDVFALFNRFDFRRRAELINQSKADLSLSIHYNMAKTPEINRLVVFVHGDVLPQESPLPSERYYAFRRALEGNLPLGIDIARIISMELQRGLGVTAEQDVHGKNLVKARIDASQGIFARNLGILKRVRGPVLLVEGPCMNHPAEYQRLTRQEVIFQKKRYPKRVQQMATALFRSIQRSAGLVWTFRGVSDRRRR